MGAIAVDIENATEPITRDMVKTQLRIDGAEEDANIDMYIPLARKQVESDSSITLVAKTVKMQYEYKEDKYYLKYDTQESGIDAMTYVDADGEIVTVTDAKLHNSATPNYVTADIPDTATDIKISYSATPNPNHPVLTAVIEKMTALLTYNVQTKKEAMAVYWSIINANRVSVFG